MVTGGVALTRRADLLKEAGLRMRMINDEVKKSWWHRWGRGKRRRIRLLRKLRAVRFEGAGLLKRFGLSGDWEALEVSKKSAGALIFGSNNTRSIEGSRGKLDGVLRQRNFAGRGEG